MVEDAECDGSFLVRRELEGKVDVCFECNARGLQLRIARCDVFEFLLEGMWLVAEVATAPALAWEKFVFEDLGCWG